MDWEIKGLGPGWEKRMKLTWSKTVSSWRIIFPDSDEMESAITASCLSSQCVCIFPHHHEAIILLSFRLCTLSYPFSCHGLSLRRSCLNEFRSVMSSHFPFVLWMCGPDSVRMQLAASLPRTRTRTFELRLKLRVAQFSWKGATSRDLLDNSPWSNLLYCSGLWRCLRRIIYFLSWRISKHLNLVRLGPISKCQTYGWNNTQFMSSSLCS